MDEELDVTLAIVLLDERSKVELDELEELLLELVKLSNVLELLLLLEAEDVVLSTVLLELDELLWLD